jgi:hypothetical protein
MNIGSSGMPPYSNMGGMGGMGGISESSADAALEGLEARKRADLVKNTAKGVANANTSGIKQAIGELR